MKKILKILIGSFKINIMLLLFFNILTNLLIILIPYINGRFLNALIQIENIKKIQLFGILLIFCLIISGVSDIIYSYIYSITNEKLQFTLKFKIINKLRKIPYIEFKKFDTSYLYQRIEQDTITCCDFILSNIFTSFINLFKLLIILILIFNINIYLFIYTICILPIYFAIFSLFKKPLKDKNFEIREMQNKYYSTMNEQFTYMYNIKINSEYGNENKKMTSFFSRYIKSFKEYIGLISIFNLSQNSIALIFQIITIIIGIYFIIKKQMTVGSLVVVSSYFNITENTIKYYYNLAGDYITFKVADKRNDELLNFEEEQNGKKLISEVYNLQGNITYGYDKKLFKDLKIDLQLSDILYIIGENGCGKTTLIQILNGIINDKNILLKINGVNYTDIDMLGLRKNSISNVPQKIYMLDGKVRDYLKNTDIKEDFILNFFRLNEDKDVRNLSGGDLQFLMLVNKLFAKKQLVILDEPTSNLDVSRKLWLKEYIKRTRKGRIYVIVTHNKDEIIENSKIIYLRKENIYEKKNY